MSILKTVNRTELRPILAAGAAIAGLAACNPEGGVRAGPPGQIPPITLPEGSDVNAPEGYGIALSIVPTDYCNWRFNPDGSRVVDVTIRNTGFAGYGSGSTLYLTSVGRPPRTTSRPIPPVDAGASITIPIATPTQVLEPTFEIRIDNQQEARRTCLE